MKEIVKKILDMNLVAKDIVESMEKWGMLPPGTVDKMSEVVDNIPRTKLARYAEELAEELEKEHKVRETNLDLARLRWPVTVDIHSVRKGGFIAGGVVAVRDFIGNLYFRIQDVKEEWFVPGYILRYQIAPDGKNITYKDEVMAEKQILYIDELPVCVQVTVLKEV